METKKLEPGKVYRIRHTRKGEFIARLLEIVPGDDVDPVFLHVIYDVRYGTDQQHLSTELGKQSYRESNLRPSLITFIEASEGEDWIRTVRLPEPPAQPVIKEKKPETLADKLFGFMRRR